MEICSLYDPFLMLIPICVYFCVFFILHICCVSQHSGPDLVGLKPSP